MDSKTEVREDGKTVVKKYTISIEEYLEDLGRNKIAVTNKITQHERNIEQAKKAMKSIEDAFDEAMLNKKTIIKKIIKENFELNNYLAHAFPKEFKHKEKPKSKSQKVTTDQDKIICDRMIGVLNEDTMKYEKVHCIEEFKTEKALKTHVAKHAKKGELV